MKLTICRVACLGVVQLLSRTGLWVFDIGARQIAQETIAEQVRGKVNGQWRALIAFFDMLSYALAIVISGAHPPATPAIYRC